MLICAQSLMMFGSRFVADRRGFGAQELGVERGGQADCLGEYGGLACSGHSVQRFVPPVVGRDPKSSHGRRVVLQLRDLLFQRQARDQIARALFGAARRIEVEGGRLRGPEECRNDAE